MRRIAVLSFLALLLTACSQTQAPETTGRIEVTPGYALLTAPGESIDLSAVVFDSDGAITADEVTWHSSADAVVSVDSSGKVSAVASVGSAQIVARARGLESAPVLVLVAQTVPGAVLVSDDQVTGEIEPVDAGAEFDLGWQYRVTLEGAASLATGDLLIGTGELPVGGRVVQSSPQGSAQLVTLAVVTLDELFVALEFEESLDLSQVEPVVSEELLQSYEVRGLADGSVEYIPLTNRLSAPAPSQVAGSRALGPFECTTDTTFNLELAASPSFTLTPSLSFDVDYDLAEGGLKKLSAAGNLNAQFKFEPTVTAAFEGSLKCEVELFVIPVPIGGPIAFVLGGQVPVGAGFELKGKLALARLGLQTSATGTASLEMGITCPVADGDCTTFATGDASLETQVTPKFTDIDEQFRVEAEFSAYAFADVALGTRLFKRLRLQTLRFTASAKQKLDLSTVHDQVADSAYASTFDLSLVVQAKVGKDIEKVLRLLKFKVSALSFDLVNEPIASSPRGSFTISPGGVAPGSDGGLGQLATFRIQLDPVTYLGVDSVEKIEIFWKKPGEAGDFTLESGRPSCREIAANSGQTTFECQTDFLSEHEGVQTFYAFVHAKLFGVPVPVPLEIANDGKATVNVDPDAIDPGICEKIAGEHYLTENPSGDGVASATSYRKVSAQSNNGVAEAETYDFISVLAQDSALAGQDGYLRVRFRYRFESTGTSETSPAARASLYPRRIYESFYIFQHQASGEPEIVEEIVERDVQIRFAHNFSTSLTSSPIAIGAETFRSGGGLVKAEAEWLGMVSVLDASGNPVAVDLICTASGTDYR